ncbi:MAG: hypothetical protein QG599_432 [Pseudomonadota bacterium]|nr:hypothetical protein [Pseudomonadota bacterium]
MPIFRSAGRDARIRFFDSLTELVPLEAIEKALSLKVGGWVAGAKRSREYFL